MSVSWLVTILVSLFLFAGIWLWYWYERRTVKQLLPFREVAPHVCVRCGAIYQASRDRELTPCPSCGYENLRLHF